MYHKEIIIVDFNRRGGNKIDNVKRTSANLVVKPIRFISSIFFQPLNIVSRNNGAGRIHMDSLEAVLEPAGEERPCLKTLKPIKAKCIQSAGITTSFLS